MGFPDDFAWGVAAAAYQLEGAAYEDGRGLSVWDVFCRREGAIWKGQTGDVACDHYHRYKQDVAVMKQIGVRAYRLSVSWPRVLPEGVGQVNEKGIGFYDKLIDELLRAGIEPYVTLFHWDFPYQLYCRGGWLNRESSDWFAEYTRLLVDRLSDRVSNWITLNEPQCFIGQGHQDGFHAPGDKLGFSEMLRVGHNALLAHGKAVQVIRARSNSESKVCYAPVCVIKVPATDTAEDIEACRTSMFSITERNYWNNTWWMDPVFLGEYPADALELYGEAAPDISPGDMETISQPLDYFGANIYHGRETRLGADGRPEDAPKPLGQALSGLDWPVVPESMYWGSRFLYERYKKPILITENGLPAKTDWMALDGKVHDSQRIDYLQRFLRELDKAGRDGVDIRGYFLWSIMDNFEWACGLGVRCGLVFVDYVTQRRTLKDSAYWYKQVIASNGESLGCEDRQCPGLSGSSPTHPTPG